jgi:hypothetical protein
LLSRQAIAATRGICLRSTVMAQTKTARTNGVQKIQRLPFASVFRKL